MSSPSIAIIGAGIAGLTAGVYAQRSGFQSQIFEMHTVPGGLMTSWTCAGYTIDSCIRSLVGAGEQSAYHRLWEEMGVFPERAIFRAEVFMRRRLPAPQGFLGTTSPIPCPSLAVERRGKGENRLQVVRDFVAHSPFHGEGDLGDEVVQMPGFAIR